VRLLPFSFSPTDYFLSLHLTPLFLSCWINQMIFLYTSRCATLSSGKERPPGVPNVLLPAIKMGKLLPCPWRALAPVKHQLTSIQFHHQWRQIVSLASQRTNLPFPALILLQISMIFKSPPPMGDQGAKTKGRPKRWIQSLLESRKSLKAWCCPLLILRLRPTWCALLILLGFLAHVVLQVEQR